MAVLWTWKWRRYLFNSSTGRGWIEHVSANLLQPFRLFLQKNSSCFPTFAFNSLYYLIRHRSCYPWYRAKTLSAQRKCSRTKLRCAKQTLCSQNRVFGIHFRKRATTLSSMSLLPSFLAICPITFTTNDGIFLPVFTLNEGVPTHGSDPKWKTVCVLSGYHDRTVYDVHWWVVIKRTFHILYSVCGPLFC